MPNYLMYSEWMDNTIVHNKSQKLLPQYIEYNNNMAFNNFSAGTADNKNAHLRLLNADA